jgi:hypothetical protein
MTKMEQLLAGQRVIVSDEWLDSMSEHEAASSIRTAHNRKRLGVYDQYVAWIADAAKPTDLEYRPDRIKGQIAVGSL